MERLADLDELVLRCRTHQSQAYIAEAVACYRGGGYRATIVMTWIAVVFDLIDKFRELEIDGEAAAKTLMNEFRNYQTQIEADAPQATKQALEFERTILTKAKELLSLLDPMQFVDLERLRDDRHRCAHPSFNHLEEVFRPSAELARLHLRSGIMHVLSRPPRQGKAALLRLRSMVASDYFPVDVGKARTQLSSGGLAHPTEKLVRDFVDDLIFGFQTSTHSLFQSSNVGVAMRAVLELHRGEAEGRLGTQMSKAVTRATDDQLPIAVNLLANLNEAWSLLGMAGQERIASFIEHASFTDLEAAIPGLAKIDDLVSKLSERIGSFATAQIELLLENSELGAVALPGALAKYLASPSFNVARGRRRKLMMPLVDFFTESDLEILFSGARDNSQVNGETNFKFLINKLRERSIVSTQKFTAMTRGLVED